MRGRKRAREREREGGRAIESDACLYVARESERESERERERERERDLLQSQLNLYLTTLVRGEGGGVQGSFKYDI